MRSLEYLAQLYPNKKAKELLAIQAEEKAAEQERQDKAHAKQIEFAKDLNDNGGFFKGVFGLDQHYYYNITNVSVTDRGELIGDVEKIVIFLGADRSVVRKGEMSFEVKKKEYECLDNYGLYLTVRTDKKDYDECLVYLNGVAKFFDGVREKITEMLK